MEHRLAGLVVGLLALLLLVSGCASPPRLGGAGATLDATRVFAADAGLRIRSIEADGFDLLVLEKPAPAAQSVVTLASGRASGQAVQPPLLPRVHVYLSGDGAPWRGKRIAVDPSPRKPVAVALMQRDPAAAFYLGRPCYHRDPQAGDASPRCNRSLWTFERYGKRVVSAMASGLAELLAQLSTRERPVHVTLIGYSGGGVLALLIAQRLPAVDEVVTIAAPLDTAVWTESRGFTPLLGSLNPTTQPLLGGAVRELHLQGGADSQVPPATTERYFRRDQSGRISRVVIPDAEHRCCWLKHWPLPVLERWQSARPD